MEEARASAQRSLQMLDGTLTTGVETLVEVDRQGEQLRRARRRLDEIDDHMKESDHLLRGMGSWLGALYNKVAAPAPAPSARSSSTSTSTSTIPSSSSSSSASSSSYWGLPSFFYGSSAAETKQAETKTTVPSLLKDPEAKRFWEETDEQLDQMEERIERLHALAVDMGGEFEKQQGEIEELDRKVQQTNESLRERTLKIFRLS